jgi:catechol 2,3-dioxygenase-like lactoylglutathione lyase family enzyme
MICLDHVHVFSSDIEKTIHFYTTMFGARVVYDTPLMGKRNVRLDIGGMAMHVYDQKPRSADRGLLNHLGMRTDDLDSLVEHMQANGVTFRKAITEAESFRYVMCEAPDGVLLELYQVKEGGEWMVGKGELMNTKA